MKAQRIFTSLLSTAALTALLYATALATARAEDDEDRFHQNEFNISPFGIYVEKIEGNWGGGVDLSYFPFKRFGLGAATYWTDFKGTFFDNVEGEGYFRLPVLKIVAPYAVGGVGYQFDREYVFESVGLGVDFRPFKNITAFGDAQYRFSNDHSESKDGALIRLGLRLSF